MVICSPTLNLRVEINPAPVSSKILKAALSSSWEKKSRSGQSESSSHSDTPVTTLNTYLVPSLFLTVWVDVHVHVVGVPLLCRHPPALPSPD